MTVVGACLILLCLWVLDAKPLRSMSAAILALFFVLSTLNVVYGFGNATMAISALFALALPVSIFPRVRAKIPDYSPWRDHLVWAIALVIWLSVRNIAAAAMLIDLLPAVGALGALALVERYRNEVVELRALAPTLLSVYIGAGAMVAGVANLEPWAECRSDKCSVFGSLYRSIYPGENTVALFSAIAIAFTLAEGRLTAARALRIALLGTFLVASGSRAPQAALLLALPIAGMLGVLARRPDGGFRVQWFTSFVVFGGIATGALWLMETSSSEAFTDRGSIWRAGLDSAGVTDFDGVGYIEWDLIRERAFLGEVSPHSTYLYLLVGGGLIAVLLFVTMASRLMADVRGVSRIDLALQVLPIVTFAVVGVVEVGWFVASLDAFTPVFLLLLWRPGGAPAVARSPVEVHP
jgi:hypothetical protein